MDSIYLNLPNVSDDSDSRLQMIRSALANHRGNISIDFLFDIFQNLILDCKYLTQCNSNRYLNTIYQIYGSVNEQLYNLRIKADDFNVLKVIGQGAFGQVQLVRHIDTGQLYALKIMNKAQMKSQEGSVFWKEERDIMAKIDSRWIVKLHYAFQDSRRLYMAMEYLPGGNLVTWMAKLDDVLEADACFYCAEIVLALNVLHENNFVHRDIKPDNVLLDIRGHIKLADFGSCVRVDPVSKYATCNRAVGTPDYISPEVLLSQTNHTNYGCEVDWWALGVMLYEIFYGDPPFYSDTLITTYGKIMTHQQSLTFPPDAQISRAAISLMKGLICDRSERLGDYDGSRDIRMHSFFLSQKCRWNWDNIHEFEAPFVPNLQNDWDTSHFEITEDDDGSDLFSNESAKELGSKVFSGENLQFSGFSYSDIFKNITPNIPTVDLISCENVQTEKAEDCKSQSSKIYSLNKEIQDLKTGLEKLSIEKDGLETQLQSAVSKWKAEEGVSKKLQTDLSDLLTKHGLCQQKFAKVEDENHKLYEDIAEIRSNATGESRRLLSQIESQREEISSVNTELADTQSEYQKSRLQNLKLENDLKFIQKKYEALELEMYKFKRSSDIATTQKIQSVEEDRYSQQLKKLQLDYDENRKDLEKLMIENQNLSSTVSNLQREKENGKMLLSKLEDLRNKENEAFQINEKNIKEKDATIETMKQEISQYQMKLKCSSRVENSLNLQMDRLTKTKAEEKSRYENEIEDQRRKLNSIISSKATEIQQLKTTIDTLTDENGSLKNEAQMEKSKCLVLVSKIDEIITGKSTSAREMMITEDMKSGILGKRSGRYYNQVLKEYKKLQSLYQQVGKDALKTEKELKMQIENLTKDKEILENEIASIKRNKTLLQDNQDIVTGGDKYHRESIITVSSRSSQDSGLPREHYKITQSRSHNRDSIPPSKPTMLHHSSAPAGHSDKDMRKHSEKSSDVLLRQNKIRVVDSRRGSISESVISDFHGPDGQLDVNVKVKGKKMSWEKCFVKIEDHNLLFYNQSLETCFLKLPFSSIVLVRKANSADVIHAKKAEIPRIFQIIYDKNRTLYSEVKLVQSRSGSTSSVNTIGSCESKDSTDMKSSDLCKKRVTRRASSIQKYFPKFLSRAHSKGFNPEINLNAIDADAVIIRGHIFQPFTVESKTSCDICQKPLINTATRKDLRIVFDNGTAMSSNRQQFEPLSSTVDSARNYKCYHCSMSAHGLDLSGKLNACESSVAMQICRASSEDQLNQWVQRIGNAVSNATRHRSSDDRR